MTDITNRPLAAGRFKSYRYKGRYGWVMIGAVDNDDALREAARSIAPAIPALDKLEIWDGWRYIPA